MNDHYYTRTPSSASRPAECTFSYRGEELVFQTDAGVFSRGEVDTGTRLLLEALPETLQGLSGMGDLIVTCASMHSRNRRAGILIGEGWLPLRGGALMPL